MGATAKKPAAKKPPAKKQASKKASSTALKGRTETRNLDTIAPYWRNPRDITSDAINAVATSIERFGYNQPIVVDTKGVIVVGHTRYAALKKLGWTEAEVVVLDIPPKKANEYRLVDNKAGEIAKWKEDELLAELREFSKDGIDTWFKDSVLDFNLEGFTPTTKDDLDKAGAVTEPMGTTDERGKQVICPGCYHEFYVE